jgi:hypothetical protein
MGEGSIVDSRRAFKVPLGGFMGSLITVSLLLDGRPLSAAAATFRYDGLDSLCQRRSFSLASRITGPPAAQQTRPATPGPGIGLDFAQRSVRMGYFSVWL